MSIVTVKNKFQIVIPQTVRRQFRVSVGDLLEAAVERGKLTFTPKALVDRGIAESLADFKRGRHFGPFATHDAFVASLHAEAKKLRVKRRGRSPE
jgi:AbrB family looped-hinge helix DNA binding protein